MTEHVIVVPYDSEWPRRFAKERSVLAALFGGTEAAIEHVGSTAVPGLGAKPVIDVMIGVPTLIEIERRRQAIEAAGYEYVQRQELHFPERRYFHKPQLSPRAFHLHCVVKGSAFWIRLLTFRDYLRAHPESAEAYYNLKLDLAMELTKEQYTKAKSPFIEDALASVI